MSLSFVSLFVHNLYILISPKLTVVFKKDNIPWNKGTRKINKNDYNKQWRRDNPEKTKEYDKQNYYKHREQKLKQKREYYQLNKERMNKKSSIYYMENKEELGKKQSVKRKEYYLKNRLKIIERTSKYQKDNPEVSLKSHKKHLEKCGNWYDKRDHQSYMSALISWTKVIRKRDDDNCQICDEKAEFVHHILFKAKIPKLSLNENNGISLCKIHHDEIHRLNGK